MSFAVQYISALGAWIGDHPLLASVTFWPVLTALVTWAFKKRTPEEFSAMALVSPRKAQFLRLVGALGLDAPKVLEVVGQLLKGEGPPPRGKSTPPPRPGAGGLLVVLLVIAAPFLLVGGTTSCAAFRSDAKTVLDVAKIACIVANQTLPDSKVAELCDTVGPLFGPMQDVLSSARTATKKALAERAGGPGCGDGGAP